MYAEEQAPVRFQSIQPFYFQGNDFLVGRMFLRKQCGNIRVEIQFFD